MCLRQARPKPHTPRACGLARRWPREPPPTARPRPRRRRRPAAEALSARARVRSTRRADRRASSRGGPSTQAPSPPPGSTPARAGAPGACRRRRPAAGACGRGARRAYRSTTAAARRSCRARSGARLLRRVAGRATRAHRPHAHWPSTCARRPARRRPPGSVRFDRPPARRASAFAACDGRRGARARRARERPRA